MNEIWICHHSVVDWSDPEKWVTFLERAQGILNAPLTHLDVNDPVRRKVVSVQDAGQFICDFGPGEESRWLLGKFRSIGVDISIQHYRRIGHYANSFKWHFPLAYCQGPDEWEIVRRLFSLGNECLGSFYSYADTADTMAAIAAKKRVSGAIDIQAELLGVFWLTYFCATYVEFFGRDRFTGLPGVKITADGGASLDLAKTPILLSQEERNRAASELGRASFVDMADCGVKPRGQFALTFEQLASSPRQ